MAGRRDEFSRSVFVNCPFDSDYLPLLRPLLFTILDLRFIPRIASERSDSGESRIEKISGLIGDCRYSIHDLSRLRASQAGEFSRMNMPFELGIEYGSRLFGPALLETVGLRRVHSATTIWYRFTDFASDFYDARVADGFTDDDLNLMPVPEYIDFIQSWVSKHQ